MPKMKTHKAGAKRYKVTASGKILREKAGKKHLLAHKGADRKRRLTGTREVSPANLEKIKLELPYIKKFR
ncbi:MAG: 50S ribosomal protein L35 [Candidatus Gastranaerophilales bacterium]|nr:50S ribosomal protein L35 [Candidatus Gastranaerophilales bacterium]